VENQFIGNKGVKTFDPHKHRLRFKKIRS